MVAGGTIFGRSVYAVARIDLASTVISTFLEQLGAVEM